MRLIDAEPLEEILRSRCAQCSNDYGSLAGAISGCLKLLQVQPTITPPPNESLTLDELWKMNGEPVWCCDPDAHLVGRWGLVWVEPFWGPENFCVHMAGSICAYFKTYGVNWIAYRRKPEEETM